MRSIRLGWAISLCFAAGALLCGFILAERWSITLFILALALAWEIDRRLKFRWLAAVLLLAYCSAAIYGLWIFAWSGWSWIALAASLAVWDLSHYGWRFQSAMYIVDGNIHARRHILRLLLVLAIGGLFALVAVLAQIRLSFGLALLLGALVVFGLSQGINLFKRSE